MQPGISVQATKNYQQGGFFLASFLTLLIYFCLKMRKQGHWLTYNQVIATLYMNIVKRIRKTLSTLHEDLQLDYEETLKNL